jgi:phytoene synthase
VSARPAHLVRPPDALARDVIARHSKSFSLAARLLPRAVRRDAVALYAYCRSVDDAIDAASPAEQSGALVRLEADLEAVYAGGAVPDPLLAMFQTLVHARGIPRLYPEELLRGMRMDVVGTRYGTVAELLRYCYRVAGTVGLMMCHVTGVRRAAALPHAADLGIAMQLTNIARDVLEDWERDRLYLPEELLARYGAAGLHRRLGNALPASAAPAVARAVQALLARADAFYRSGDAGLAHLSPRCAFAVRAARLVYARIRHVVRSRGGDPRAGRAVVGKGMKAALVARAGLETLRSLPGVLGARRTTAPHGKLSLDEALAFRRGPR